MLHHQLFQTLSFLALSSGIALAVAHPRPDRSACTSGSANVTEYDYVIIGSGAGGGTLGATLARKGHSVFLIEAGGDHGEDPHQNVPGLTFFAGEDETMAWTFYVRHFSNETQAKRDSKFTYRLPDGSIYFGLEPPEDAKPLGTVYPRGATLGGSTQINAMNFIKPRPEDWDYVAEVTGDDSWSAEAMEYYFATMESAQYLPLGTPGHGFKGPISSNHNNVTFITGRPSVAQVMANLEYELSGATIESLDEQTELLQRDINGVNSFIPGAYQLVVSTTASRRRSGARHYITETVNAKYENGSARYPLTISTHSLATRILFHEGAGEPRAYGVEYMVGEGLYGADPRYDPDQKSQSKRVTASKEVIVAGGAINTPQILKLSGIGPKDELKSLGIPVVVDLPAVGKYLQDHTEAIINVNASAPWENDPNAPCNFALNSTDPCFVEWEESGTGPYGEGAASLGLISRSTVCETKSADLFWFGWPSVLARGFYPGFSHTVPRPNTFTWDVVKLHVPGDGNNAKGTVTLRSKDPREVPDIDFDWLSGDAGQRDLDALVEGAELAYKGWSNLTSPLAPIIKNQPGEGVDARQNIKDEAFGHHASSSCRIGPKGGDIDYCVDPQLRVNGVKNLRVVDASVFPHTPGAFPATSVYMLGLKAADMISADA